MPFPPYDESSWMILHLPFISAKHSFPLSDPEQRREGRREEGGRDGCMHAWIHGCMDTWMDRWMHAWVGGCEHAFVGLDERIAWIQAWVGRGREDGDGGMSDRFSDWVSE